MPPLRDQRLGRATVLFGERDGKYPDANCVLVEGDEERVLLDTTPGLVARGRAAVGDVDRVLLTHAHEDHMAGNFLFPEASIHVHGADLEGARSLEGMLDIYGGDVEHRRRLAAVLVDRFHYRPRADAVPFVDGSVFDLGGGVTVEAIHTPGHTRGHCAFRVEPDGLLFLGDVDLSSFGPYYGDAWSDLEDFERSIDRLRRAEARTYLSGHHIGLLPDRDAFLERLERYAARIPDRERRLLDFLAEPRTLAEIVAHRLVYRPQDDGPGVAAVELRSAGLHLERLERAGTVEELEPGLWSAIA